MALGCIAESVTELTVLSVCTITASSRSDFTASRLTAVEHQPNSTLSTLSLQNNLRSRNLQPYGVNLHTKSLSDGLRHYGIHQPRQSVDIKAVLVGRLATIFIFRYDFIRSVTDNARMSGISTHLLDMKWKMGEQNPQLNGTGTTT